MQVREVMSRDVVTVSRGTAIVEAVAVASDQGVEYLPVLDSERVVGMLSATELASSRLDRDAAGQMHVPVACVDAGVSVEEAIDEMNASDVSCLLAMEGDRLVGILTRGDLLRAGFPEDLVVGERRCSACGTYRHVHRHARDDLLLCVECADRSIAPRAGDELGVAG